MTINSAVVMWLVVSQENHIRALKLLQYFQFQHVKGVGFFYMYAMWKSTCVGQHI